MVKIFAIHEGAAYMQTGKTWARCSASLAPTGETAALKPTALYSAAEVTAKLHLRPVKAAPVMLPPKMTEPPGTNPPPKQDK
jgi:hypothetical protein